MHRKKLEPKDERIPNLGRRLLPGKVGQCRGRGLLPTWVMQCPLSVLPRLPVIERVQWLDEMK